jgi:hypothetical protein
MEKKNEILDFFCEMLTSLQYKCVNKSESESEEFSKSEIFGLRLGLLDVRKALADIID